MSQSHFKFPEINMSFFSNTAKIVKIGVVFFVCCIIALVVNSVVKERVNRAQDALANNNSLVPLVVPFPTNVDPDNQNPFVKASSIVATISNLTNKTLGKQHYISFDVAVDVFVPTKDFPGTISLVDSADNSIAFTKSTEDDTVKISYVLKGINSIEFPLIDVPYDAKVVTDYEKIRINRSDIGTFEKSTGVTYRIPEMDEYYSFESEIQNPQVKFMTQGEDLQFVDRISKYALLVVLLVFSLMFFMDIAKGFSASSFQYLLVGVSLALFYLLVLALGEEIGYLSAYIAGTLLTAAINWWYMSSVLDSKKYGTVFGLLLVVLYGALYGLLKLYSFNLLLGVVILYAILLLFMRMSKNMNKKTV